MMKKKTNVNFRLLAGFTSLALVSLLGVWWFLIRPGAGPQTVDLINAPEIPLRSPDLAGSVLNLQEHGLAVLEDVKTELTGVKRGENGEIISEVKSEGWGYEVLVTHNTQIYQDVTFEDQTSRQEGEIQQRIRLIELDEIERKGSVSVWGKKHGDGYVADIILYNPPVQADTR